MSKISINILKNIQIIIFHAESLKRKIYRDQDSIYQHIINKYILWTMINIYRYCFFSFASFLFFAFFTTFQPFPRANRATNHYLRNLRDISVSTRLFQVTFQRKHSKLVGFRLVLEVFQSFSTSFRAIYVVFNQITPVFSPNQR